MAITKFSDQGLLSVPLCNVQYNNTRTRDPYKFMDYWMKHSLYAKPKKKKLLQFNIHRSFVSARITVKKKVDPVPSPPPPVTTIQIQFNKQDKSRFSPKSLLAQNKYNSRSQSPQ